MSYLTHGGRKPPRPSVTVAGVLTAIVVVLGPVAVVGYLLWEWLA